MRVAPPVRPGRRAQRPPARSSPSPSTQWMPPGSPNALPAVPVGDVAVNAVAANWSLLHTVTDTVHLAATHANASLAADAALLAGTTHLTGGVPFKTAASATITASDVTDGTKT